jgi:hypothetical protein
MHAHVKASLAANQAGFPQEDINEIHGSWFDPSNPGDGDGDGDDDDDGSSSYSMDYSTASFQTLPEAH